MIPGSRLLIVCMLLSGFCGIVAELCLFNLGSLLIGGTNRTLLMTMGLMMFAMGLGSWLAGRRMFESITWDTFAFNELALSLVCMSSVSGIYWLASHELRLAPWLLMGWSLATGVLIGLEIPLILRLNEKLGSELQQNSSGVLMADYIGSLFAFAAFPFFLLPGLGLHLTAWFGGSLNLLLALLAFTFHREKFQRKKSVLFLTIVCMVLAIVGFTNFEALKSDSNQRLFRDEVIFQESTPYQNVILTAQDPKDSTPWAGAQQNYRSLGQMRAQSTTYEIRQYPDIRGRTDVRLFLNGGLQFSTIDEHRYHEMLVHPPAHLAMNPQEALILGGGDGLALREVLQLNSIQSAILVDPDETLVEWFTHSSLKELNDSAFRDPRLKYFADDAFHFLLENKMQFPLILIDFPDPHHLDLARLYSREFFALVRQRLSPKGCINIQSTSPLFTPKAFLSIRKTMQAAGLQPLSLKVSMQSFEDWGFQLACKHINPNQIKAKLETFKNPDTVWLNADVLGGAWRFGKGFFDSEARVNSIESPVLPDIYNQGR